MKFLVALPLLAGAYLADRQIKKAAEPPPALSKSRDPLANPGRVTHTRIEPQDSEWTSIWRWMRGNVIGSITLVGVTIWILTQPKKP